MAKRLWKMVDGEPFFINPHRVGRKRIKHRKKNTKRFKFKKLRIPLFKSKALRFRSHRRTRSRNPMGEEVMIVSNPHRRGRLRRGSAAAKAWGRRMRRFVGRNPRKRHARKRNQWHGDSAGHTRAIMKRWHPRRKLAKRSRPRVARRKHSKRKRNAYPFAYAMNPRRRHRRVRNYRRYHRGRRRNPAMAGLMSSGGMDLTVPRTWPKIAINGTAAAVGVLTTKVIPAWAGQIPTVGPMITGPYMSRVLQVAWAFAGHWGLKKMGQRDAAGYFLAGSLGTAFADLIVSLFPQIMPMLTPAGTSVSAYPYGSISAYPYEMGQLPYYPPQLYGEEMGAYEMSPGAPFEQGAMV